MNKGIRLALSVVCGACVFMLLQLELFPLYYSPLPQVVALIWVIAGATLAKLATAGKMNIVLGVIVLMLSLCTTFAFKLTVSQTWEPEPEYVAIVLGTWLACFGIIFGAVGWVTILFYQRLTE